jgi:hypothetical protein
MMLGQRWKNIVGTTLLKNVGPTLAYVGMATVGKMTLGQHWKNNVGTTLLNK